MMSKMIKRKESIIISAIEVLDELGVNGMTTKEIARRQNITEPAIYKHFNGKKEILKEIFKRYSIYDQDIKNTIIDNCMSGKEAIRYFCKVYAEYYQSYPEITTIMFSFDIFKYDKEMNEDMKIIIDDRYKFLLGHVSKAVEKKEMLVNTNIQAITDSIFSILWATTFLWRMENCSFDVKDRILLAVDSILNI